jgi:hypothetical protein
MPPPSADSRRSPLPGVSAKPTAGSANRQPVQTQGSNHSGCTGVPPAYRPRNAPAQMTPDPVPANLVRSAAPPVYCPAKVTVSAPPVYRPNVASPLQRKPGIVGPPVYRPQPAVQQQAILHPVRPRPANPAGVPFSGVAQPAGCCSAIGNCLGAVWNSLTSCFSRPTQHQAIPLDEIDELTTIQVDRPTQPDIRHVPEGGSVNDLDYPSGVHGGYISSCALVIFCGDDTFDCYHAKGGSYNPSHGMRGNPTQIYFVYKSTPYDSTECVRKYRANADNFRRSGGNAPMQFLGQTGVNGNVMVLLRSAHQIEPVIGEFV